MLANRSILPYTVIKRRDSIHLRASFVPETSHPVASNRLFAGLMVADTPSDAGVYSLVAFLRVDGCVLGRRDPKEPL